MIRMSDVPYLAEYKARGVDLALLCPPASHGAWSCCFCFPAFFRAQLVGQGSAFCQGDGCHLVSSFSARGLMPVAAFHGGLVMDVQ